MKNKNALSILYVFTYKLCIFVEVIEVLQCVRYLHGFRNYIKLNFSEAVSTMKIDKDVVSPA